MDQSMCRMAGVGTAGIVLLTLAACGSIISSSSSSSRGSGVVYMLPRALLPVELTEHAGAFTLSVQQPVMMGDPKKRFVLERSSNPFSSDNVEVTVNPNTGLLQAVKVESTDQTLSTVVKLVSAAKAKAESADAGAVTNLVYRGLLDPSEDPRRINDELKLAIAAYLGNRLALACDTPDQTDCEAVRQLTETVSTGAFQIQLTSASDSATPTTQDAVDCKVGLCYRQNQPYILKLTGPHGETNTVLASLPNGSPTYVLPVERWAFVKSTHDITLQDGVLQSVITDRPSSALAIAGAPVDAAKSVFGAIGEILQLKIDLSGKETSLANAKVAEINAKSELDKALLAKKGGKAEAALSNLTPERSALATLTVGSPKVNDVLDELQTPGAAARGGRETQSHDGDLGGASSAGDQ